MPLSVDKLYLSLSYRINFESLYFCKDEDKALNFRTLITKTLQTFISMPIKIVKRLRQKWKNETV